MAPKTDRVSVISLNGDVEDTAVLADETVEQFIQRISVEKGDASDECVVLLLGNRILPPDQSLHDCGLLQGATLTLVRERQCRLRLTAAFYADSFGKSQPLWVDKCSPGAKFCLGAAAWCFKFEHDCTEGACGAVCSLENPGQMQRLVDTGGLSKTEAVKGILACFIYSILAVGRIGSHAGRDGIGDPRDNEMATTILRENLHHVACGVDVLRDWSSATDKFSSLSRTYLASVREYDAMNLGACRQHVRLGCKHGCELHACKVEDIVSIWSDEDDDLIGWKQLLEQLARTCECSGSSQTCDECCNEGWVSFLRDISRPGNMWFQIKDCRGDSSDFDGFAGGLYKFAGGVYDRNEEVAPNQLPPYYVFQWAMVD